MSACFDATYDGMNPCPIRPSIDEMPTIAEPGFASSSVGRSTLTSIASARTFTPRTVSQVSTSIGPSSAGATIPAACTSPPTEPSAAFVVARAASTAADVGDVDLHADRRRSERLGVPGGVARAFTVEVPRRDRATDLGERKTARAPDTRRSPGDDHPARRLSEHPR